MASSACAIPTRTYGEPSFVAWKQPRNLAVLEDLAANLVSVRRQPSRVEVANDEGAATFLR
jgi:hypothetical protein